MPSIGSPGSSSEIGFCTGKDCRKSDGFLDVRRDLRNRLEMIELPCLDVCDGPVVVLRPRAVDATVIGRVRSRGLAADVVDHVIDGAPMSGRLKKRRLRGSKRARARRRVERAL